MRPSKTVLAIGKQTRAAGSAITDSVSIEHEKKAGTGIGMIHAYRFRGHQRANL